MCHSFGKSLKQAVQHKGIEVVVEEAAYTWFNQDDGAAHYGEEWLRAATAGKCYRHGTHTSDPSKSTTRDLMVSSTTEQTRLQKIIGDYSKDQEAFALLLVGYCHNHKTLQSCLW